MTTLEPRSGSGSRELVALRIGNRTELVRRIFECWGAGKAVLPLDPLWPDAAVRAVLDSLRPNGLVTGSGQTFLDGAPVAQTTAVVLLTSGTSGQAKGVELSEQALEWSAKASLGALGNGGEGRWLCCLPPHHIAGLMVVMRASLSGSLPIIHEKFDVDAVRKETRADFISLVPSALDRLLKADTDLSRFSAILLGGGPVRPGLVEQAAQKGGKVITTYGMTETCGGCVYDGMPLKGADVALAGERVRIRGPMLFHCYRLQPRLTSDALKNGWFHTSDRGRFSPDGRLEILGRMDDVIITGGKKVSAAEIERILTQHPAIEEAAVIGLSSETWGQEIAAALVLRPGRTIEPAELRSFVAERAPTWAFPKRTVRVSALPKSSTGKILRPEVAGLFDVEQEMKD